MFSKIPSGLAAARGSGLFASLGEPQVLFFIDAVTEFPQHRSSESVDIVWNYLETTITLDFVVTTLSHSNRVRGGPGHVSHFTFRVSRFTFYPFRDLSRYYG